MNAFSEVLQSHVQASDLIQDYALDLWEATQAPVAFGVQLDSVDVNRMVHTGASPRGMGMLLKAARVHAWLMQRDSLYPEDIHAVFHEIVAHRLVLNPMYESRRTALSRALTQQILSVVQVPARVKAA